MLRRLDASSERWLPCALAFFAGVLVGHAHVRVGIQRAIHEALGQRPPAPREKLPELRELTADVVGLGAEASTDLLTEVLNRRGLERYLAIHGAAGPGMAMVDLDHFKQVNDRYGHSVGDLVLREVAARLSRAIGDAGAVGRWGGEEFLVVVPGVSGAHLFELGESIRLAVRGGPITAENNEVNVTCSVGVAAPDLERETVAEGIARADRALLLAKQTRDTVCGAEYLRQPLVIFPE